MTALIGWKILITSVYFCLKAPTLKWIAWYAMQIRYFQALRGNVLSAMCPATLRFHDFPLDHGGQGVVECATCHTTTYLAYSCYECHEHQPAEIQEEHLDEGISLNELENCVSCHPTGLEDGD